MNSPVENAMRIALGLARETLGRTAPNPPVGAAALDLNGQVLAACAHPGAGLPHAEALVFAELREKDLLARAHAMVVTLEPCNHTGRTGPCSEALISAGIREVAFACKDPNPVASGGEERLRSAGLKVTAGVLEKECAELIVGFRKWVQTGLPYVTVKRAFNEKNSMIPGRGQKTFTRESSLKLAHELRRRSDAILTGSGTVLADRPLFTVREVRDHPGKKRWLVVFDRRGHVPRDWVGSAESRGFEVEIARELEPALRRLGERGAHHVLVEAGPALSQQVLESGLWDEKVDIFSEAEADRVVTTMNAHPIQLSKH